MTDAEGVTEHHCEPGAERHLRSTCWRKYVANSVWGPE